MPEGQGVGRRRKRVKPTSGATRHLLPEEGGRSGENYLLPSRGRGMPEGQGVGRRRKRAKPTSGAARHLLPEEGGSIHASPFLWKGLPSTARRGWLLFLAAKPPPLCLPHWGRETALAVDRVLSYIAYLRRSPSLSFIPLEPYPPLRGTFPTRGRLVCRG